MAVVENGYRMPMTFLRHLDNKFSVTKFRHLVFSETRIFTRPIVQSYARPNPRFLHLKIFFILPKVIFPLSTPLFENQFFRSVLLNKKALFDISMANGPEYQKPWPGKKSANCSKWGQKKTWLRVKTKISFSEIVEVQNLYCTALL